MENVSDSLLNVHFSIKLHSTGFYIIIEHKINAVMGEKKSFIEFNFKFESNPLQFDYGFFSNQS